jgi:hypothetical protein
MIRIVLSNDHRYGGFQSIERSDAPSPAGRAVESLLDAFRRRGGVMTRDQIDLEGHTARSIGQALRLGLISRSRQGVYRLAETAPFGETALIEASAYVPRGIVCLVSALRQHELVTQIPSAVQLAVPRDANEPVSGEVPIRLVRMASRFLVSDVREIRPSAGGKYRIFTPERSVCDAFRFRRQLGEDVAYEALRTLLQGAYDRDTLIEAAELTRTNAYILPALRTLSA